MSSPSPSTRSRVVPLAQARGAGGKARGLAGLIELGLPVPDGFAVVDAHLGVDAAYLDHSLAALAGAPMAVRSSADVEDGVVQSWAGQFTTTLDVRGPQAVLQAIEACVASRAGERVQAYADVATRMHVVVQRMVAAKAAGVCFTADPVSGRRDRVVLEVVPGVGEALVAGHAQAERYLTDWNGAVVSRELLGATPLLSDELVRALVKDALRAADAFHAPLDLEWAIDEAGQHHWLQARPITTLGPDLALDTPSYVGHVYTRSNVGEMLPGIVTPLTRSIFGESMDRAMLAMARFIGLERVPLPHEPYVCSFDGQLFFDLSRIWVMGSGMLGGTKADVDLSIVGRVLDVGEAPPAPPTWQRAVNGLRYVGLLLTAPSRVDAMEDRSPPPELTPTSPHDVRAWFERARAWADEGWEVHIASSAVAGTTCSAVLQTLSNRAPPQAEHFATASQLLEGVSEAESARLLSDVLAFGDVLRADPAGRGLLEGDPAALRSWLGSEAPRRVRAAWQGLLETHGHRCIRESELRAPEWASDPTELLALVRSAGPADVAPVRHAAVDRAALPFGARVALAVLVPQARVAVARRERSKSLAVRRYTVLKRGYRVLAAHLAATGRLAHADEAYFLTHDELMRLTTADEPALRALAVARRRLFEERQSLRLPELSVGRPEVEPPGAEGVNVLRGTPVSRGVVRGRVRVALGFADAQALSPGEILVVPHIDVGWTPFFRVAAGVVTELGSPLSHAAVVAREYGIPTVVNVTGATRTLKTGDEVELDGALGTIARVTTLS